MTTPRLQCLDFWKSRTNFETFLLRCGFWNSGDHIWNRKPKLGVGCEGDVLAVTQSQTEPHSELVG